MFLVSAICFAGRTRTSQSRITDSSFCDCDMVICYTSNYELIIRLTAFVEFISFHHSCLLFCSDCNLTT